MNSTSVVTSQRLKVNDLRPLSKEQTLSRGLPNATPNVSKVNERPVALSPNFIAQNLDALQTEHFDVLVIGGGIVGAGVALDAVTRGLRVAIVEQGDWASGTSSQSSKLIHGGLRYLEMRDFSLVSEALHERSLLLRLAPHLVQAIPFLLPLRSRFIGRAYIGSGVLLYDLLARTGLSRSPFPFHRQLSRRRALSVAPSLNADTIVGAIRYWDAQVDDARFAFSVLRTAATHGATVASGIKVVKLLRDKDSIVGARAMDRETGRSFDINAKAVISATGVWTEQFVTQTANEPTTDAPLANVVEAIVPSKGIHLVVPRAVIVSDSALIFRTKKSVLLVLPWGDHWLIGTTDTPWRLGIERSVATATDIDYLLSTVNKILKRPVLHSDIESVYVGLRPLIARTTEESTQLSREHAVSSPLRGLIVISGGKYTTYRVMAEDGVDTAVKLCGLTGGPSMTASTPLIGAHGIHALRQDVERLAKMHRLSKKQIEHLLGRYGNLIDEVLAPTVRDGSLSLPLEFARGYLRCEISYAVTHEGARHLDDVLRRRTRISIETSDRGRAATDEVAAIMAERLGWDDTESAKEIATYCSAIAAEIAGEHESDDRSALDHFYNVNSYALPKREN